MAGNGGAPRGFLGHRMPFSSGGGPRFRPKLATAAAAGVGVLAVGGAVYHHHTAQGQKGPRLQLQPWTVAAFAGAIGEVAAIALLYPLDTIKVGDGLVEQLALCSGLQGFPRAFWFLCFLPALAMPPARCACRRAIGILRTQSVLQVRCQAAGMTAKEVVADLLRENGFGLALFRKLWAGVTAGMLCSVIVGAVHFASYDTARRFILPIACPSCKPSAASSPHDSALTHFDTTGEVEAPGSEDAETRRGKMLATFMAAALAAVATALIESPVELFRCGPTTHAPQACEPAWTT